MMAYIVGCESVLKTLEPARTRAEVLILRSGQGNTLEHLRITHTTQPRHDMVSQRARWRSCGCVCVCVCVRVCVCDQQ
jgi:hypothetical protein